MKLVFKLLPLFCLFHAKLIYSQELYVRCSEELMEINGVLKDVRVKMYTEYEGTKRKYALSITTKPGNSPSYRSNPIPNDPVFFKDYVIIQSNNDDQTLFKTDSKINGYNVVAHGNLFPSTAKDPCTSYVQLELIPYGNPSLKIKDTFRCSADCNW